MTNTRRQVLFALHQFAERMHRGVADYAREHQWDLRSIHTLSGPIWQMWRGDGILCGLTGDDALVKFIRAFPGPKVEFSINDHGPAFGRVGEDCAAIGTMAGDYFVQKGFRHFCCFMGGRYAHTLPVAESFGEITRGRALSTRVWVGEDMTRDPARLASGLSRLLKRAPKPLALYCVNDSLAELALIACTDAGIGVPDEVSILGTGNISFICEHAEVPISSMDTNHELWGYRAAELLDRMMDGAEPGGRALFIPPKGVIERQSSGGNAFSDPRMLKAMTFLKQSFQNPVSVDEVARVAGTSRASLNRLFRKHTGRSVNDELIQIRIRHACALLAQPDENGAGVAIACGYASPYYFYRQFKTVTGFTVKAYQARQLASNAPRK